MALPQMAPPSIMTAPGTYLKGYFKPSHAVLVMRPYFQGENLATCAFGDSLLHTHAASVRLRLGAAFPKAAWAKRAPPAEFGAPPGDSTAPGGRRRSSQGDAPAGEAALEAASDGAGVPAVGGGTPGAGNGGGP